MVALLKELWGWIRAGVPVVRLPKSTVLKQLQPDEPARIELDYSGQPVDKSTSGVGSRGTMAR